MKTIIIYLGHGDNYSGSENNIRAVNFICSFSRKLFKRIEELGGKSILIEDINISDNLIKMATESGEQGILISIHVNDCTGSGFETHYPAGSYNGTTKNLVDNVHYAYKSVANRWCIPGLPDRGIKADCMTQLRKLGAFQDTDLPVCVLEVWALNKDGSTIMNKGFQKEAADSLARVLMGEAEQIVQEPVIDNNGKMIPIEEGIYPNLTLDDGIYLIVNYSTGFCLPVDSEGFLTQSVKSKDKSKF